MQVAVSSFYDELEKIALSSKERDEERRLNDRAVGVGSLAGAGYAGTKVRRNLTGRERLYHGTTEDVAQKIRSEGLRSANSAGTSGISDVLPNDLGAKNYAYAHVDRANARSYAEQAKWVKEMKDKGEAINPATIGAKRMLKQLDPRTHFNILNPFNNKGIVEIDAPTWNMNTVRNPESRANFGEFRKAVKPVIDMRLPHDAFIQDAAVYHDLTNKTRTFADGVPSEYIKGSKNFKGVTAREILQHAKARPGRAGLGAALGLATAGLGAFGVKKLRDSFKKRGPDARR